MTAATKPTGAPACPAVGNGDPAADARRALAAVRGGILGWWVLLDPTGHPFRFGPARADA